MMVNPTLSLVFREILSLGVRPASDAWVGGWRSKSQDLRDEARVDEMATTDKREWGCTGGESRWSGRPLKPALCSATAPRNAVSSPRTPIVFGQ